MGTMHSDKAWKILGKKEPYYGVLGQDMYLKENLNTRTEKEFFESGEIFVGELFKKIHEKIDFGFNPVNILDFGCGPGRLTIPFSRYADKIVGMDISQDMLNEARINCQKFNIGNVSFLLSDDNLSLLKTQRFDLVHTFIVMQHINVKRGEKLILQLINSINPNGIGAIHLVYADSFPVRKIVNYFRDRIPNLYLFLRMIRKMMQGKRYDNLPQMQNNNYNLNKIFMLLQKANVKEIYSFFTCHWQYMGVMLIFKKETDNQN